MSKKIVVTGGTGFVGYHVVKKLLQKKVGEVFCLARKESNKKYLQTLPVTIVDGDLLDKASLEKALEGCEILFHVAADYRLWAKDGDEIVRSNVLGTRNILEAAKKYSVKKVVYTSSVAAVGRPHPSKNLEGDIPSLVDKGRWDWEKKWAGSEAMDPTLEQLIGPYKQSKFSAELVARKFAQEGMDLVIVNPSTPVGSHDIKPTPTGKLALDFLKGKMPAYLETGLNFVDVEDVAMGHLLALEKGKRGERYILGNKNLMLKEFFNILSQLTGRPTPKYKIPYWFAYGVGWTTTLFSNFTGKTPLVPLDGVKMAKEIMFYRADKAIQELGFNPGSVEKALEKSVRFFQNEGYLK